MPPTDEFGAHEVLHTAYIVQSMFAEHIAEHYYVVSSPELKAAAESMADALAEFYQRVGRVIDGAT